MSSVVSWPTKFNRASSSSTAPPCCAHLPTSTSSPAPASEPIPAWRWWTIGLLKSSTALVVVAVPLLLFATRYRLAFDGLQGENCLPYTAFLVDLKTTTLKRGEYVAFVSAQMEPFYRNGTLVVKQVTAVPGDRVRVDATGVRINDQRVGSLRHLEPGQKLWRLGRRVSDVARAEVVPAEHWWVMGTHPRSFDSRYWGYIRSEQVVGRAIPLW